MTDVLADDHGDDGRLNDQSDDDGHDESREDGHDESHEGGHESHEGGHEQGAGEAAALVDPSTARRSVDDIERLLDGVEAALARLDEGTYGACVSCGSPITDERLTASPTAMRCAACDPIDRDG
ncbi:MAG: TraR/DksA C4-type zinc finger protein [Acidimicrobiales bacterium]